ncbi:MULTISPECIES: hypothetical protein [unclassified Streptomyces]|uniref:hypothetical protein n=1 Tax=unclassified Streptomyces TaxID=2593676 RepID=UPI0004BF6019
MTPSGDSAPARPTPAPTSCSFGYLARERDLVTRIAEQLQAPRAELPDRVVGLISEASVLTVGGLEPVEQPGDRTNTSFHSRASYLFSSFGR